MVSVKMKWAGGMKFEGVGAFGHKMITDSKKEIGGEEAGFKPTELLLFGIAGCTGIDVVGILRKQRQDFSLLEIEVIGHQPDNFPKPFTLIEVKFTARGKELNADKLARAIELSEAKYCSVSQTVRNEGKVVTSFEILPEEA